MHLLKNYPYINYLIALVDDNLSKDILSEIKKIKYT